MTDQTSLWTRELPAETSRATLVRLGVRWLRAQEWITSPDPEYARKSHLQAGTRQTVAKDDPDKKALACYGLMLPQTDEVWLRFLDGRPVSAVTTAFLTWCCRQLAARGKSALLRVWDNGPWHITPRQGPGYTGQSPCWQMHRHMHQRKRPPFAGCSCVAIGHQGGCSPYPWLMARCGTLAYDVRKLAGMRATTLTPRPHGWLRSWPQAR